MIDPLSIPAFCVNLEKREDRWLESEKMFKKHGLNVSRWIAVDGSDLEIEEDSPKAHEFNAKGILGCMLSHYNLINCASKMGYEYIMVFEDDCILCDDFVDRFKYFNNVDFDLFYLGGHWDRICIDVVPETRYIHKCVNVAGTYAYIMRNTVFQFVLDNMDYRWGADQFFADMIQKNFNSRCMVPLLATHKDGYSDVVGKNVSYRATDRFYVKNMKR